MITGRLGSQNTTSSPVSQSVVETNKVSPPNVEKAYHDDIDELRHIKDSYTTKTALNPTKYSQEYNMLLGYVEGTTIVVNYFHKQEAEFDTRMHVSDISFVEDSVHKDLTEIKHFELRLTSPLDHSFDEEDNSFTITGEAVTYPGFTPYIGDIFFFRLDEGNIGEFRIDSAAPTTYRTGKYHKVTFYFIDYVSPERYDLIRSSVRETLLFDKTNYLDTGTLTLLNAQTYVDLKTLQRFRKELILYYMDGFYVPTMSSVVRPDGLYDPYVVRFLQQKFTSEDYRKRPVQLFSRLNNYNKSIWYHISDVYDKTYFDDLLKHCVSERHRSFSNMTDHNALINRDYLYLVEETVTAKPTCCCEIHQMYFLSHAFYIGDLEAMNEIEYLLYKYLKEGVVNIEKLINCVSRYKTMELMDRFYYVPILVELIDFSIVTMRN